MKYYLVVIGFKFGGHITHTAKSETRAINMCTEYREGGTINPLKYMLVICLNTGELIYREGDV